LIFLITFFDFFRCASKQFGYASGDDWLQKLKK